MPDHTKSAISSSGRPGAHLGSSVNAVGVESAGPDPLRGPFLFSDSYPVE